MTLKPEKLILDRNKLIESIWEYRWWILDNSVGMSIVVIQDKQYKRPSGQHVDIQATDIIKAKNKGYSEWRAVRRGYKDIYKWYCVDSNQDMPTKTVIFEGRKEEVFDIDIYKHGFSKKNDLQDYIFINGLDYDDLIGLSFALITYLSRYQPLKKKKKDMLFVSFMVEERLQYHFMKKIKDISLRSIRLRLKAWVDDNEDELDEEIALDTFWRIHQSREDDYINKYESHAFSLALFSETEEDEKKYYALHGKWKEVAEKRLKNCKLEAEHYWKHGTSREHLMFQRNGFWSQDMLFSDEDIKKDTKRFNRIIKARRKRDDY